MSMLAGADKMSDLVKSWVEERQPVDVVNDGNRHRCDWSRLFICSAVRRQLATFCKVLGFVNGRSSRMHAAMRNKRRDSHQVGLMVRPRVSGSAPCQFD